MSDVIYKSNTCPSCVTVENALRSNPIPGVRIMNIDTDPNARQFFALTGARAVPTAVIDGKAITGAHAILSALRMKYGRP